MSPNTHPAGMTSVIIDERERSELLALVEHALGETRVEVHHTHTPDFRAQVQLREQTLRGLIEKLRHPEA
ncbi:MAG: hypothetical protein P4L84_24940 [Isosphaeraceae bacterium]|nr:hypothetical protein [Isosphaeraceae bacterium]